MKFILQLAVILSITMITITMAMAAKPLYELSATEAAAKIKNGEITSEALVTALLEQIDAKQALNAFITLDTAGAIQAAREADIAVRTGQPLGRLHGVPVAIKDNMDVAGLPTTAGTPGMLGVVPEQDAEIVMRLKLEGAIIIGKTNLHELGFGITCDNAYFGTIRNPYNQEFMVGGSSGGNAAALAANLVPLAIGSDTGGSIRIPASLCGVYGYRPSVGRYPMGGFIPMAPTKDVVGPMARTIEDIILVDAVVTGYAPDELTPLALSGLRLGVPVYPFWQDLDSETARVTAEVLQKLEAAGVELVYADLNLPHIFAMNRYIDFYIVLHECRRDFPRYLERYGLSVAHVAAKIVDEDIKYYFENVLLNEEIMTEPRYTEALEHYRPLMILSWQKYFIENQVDFIISPTTILPARPLATSTKYVELNGKEQHTSAAYLQNTGLSSNLGFAGISMPVGFTATGLPVGLEIDTLSGNDEHLLRLVLALSAILCTNL